MGLDCSHDAFHAPYSRFNEFRKEIAKRMNLPPLMLMEGFYEPLNSGNLPTLYHGIDTNHGEYSTSGKPFLYDIDANLPIKWEKLRYNPIFVLLRHSDCDGEISPKECYRIADELEKTLTEAEKMSEVVDFYSYGYLAKKFIAGLRLAASRNESLKFQ